MDQMQNEERRRHQRFPIHRSEAVTVSPSSIISFCLLDISAEGLAFCYNGTKAPRKGADCRLDFFGEKFSMANAPVRIISDQPFDPENLPAVFKEDEDVIPSLRRCGVQFVDLTEQQKILLAKYIEGLSSEDLAEQQPQWS